MTESANYCDVRAKYSSITEHSFTKRKVIRSRRNNTKTVITVCSWCGRLGSKTESRTR